MVRGSKDIKKRKKQYQLRGAAKRRREENTGRQAVNVALCHPYCVTDDIDKPTSNNKLKKELIKAQKQPDTAADDKEDELPLLDKSASERKIGKRLSSMRDNDIDGTNSDNDKHCFLLIDSSMLSTFLDYSINS